MFLILASSSPDLRVRSDKCKIRWVAMWMWKRGCCLPAKASATMAVHARLLLGLHKRWLCISEELTEARMDMYTHMCASMCLRAFGLHKITYEYSSGASECWFAGSVTCTTVVLPMVLVCPICDDEKSSLHSCNSAFAQHFPQVPRS